MFHKDIHTKSEPLTTTELAAEEISQRSLTSEAKPLTPASVIVSLIISSFLGLLLKTIRWSEFEADKIRGGEDWGKMGPRILVIWHNQQIALPSLYFKAKRAGFKGRVFALISQHRDGRLAADIVRRLGIESVAGSSTRGGRAALSELCKLVSEGHVAVITPDGPKGPIYKLKPGAIKLAQLSGAPVYPIAISVESKLSFKSWDRLFLPLPFSKAVFLVGEPFQVPAEITDAEFEALRQELEDSLQATSDRAINYFSAT